jgi:hypothetical protein
LGLPILTHLLRQMSLRIVDYSGTTSSLHLRQPRQSLNLGKTLTLTRSHLKNRILAQSQGGTEFQPADILKYFEEFKGGPNTEIETKDFFEMTSNKIETEYEAKR